MTKEEADKIAEIVAKVDGACSVCVRDATLELMANFPDHDWKARIKAIAIRDNEYWAKEVDEWNDT